MADAPLLTNSSTTRTRSNYNRLAFCYDSWASWEAPYIDTGFDQLQIKPGDSILDIGSATGRFLARASAVTGTSSRCLGIDLSSAMCKVAQAHLPSHVEILCGDAVEVLKTSNETFDCISLMFVLELFDEPDAVVLLQTAALRLSPITGRMVIVSMSIAVENAGCMMRCYGCCRWSCPSVVDCRPIDVLGLVETVNELEVVSRLVLPMYGLAVEMVEVKRKINKPNQVKAIIACVYREVEGIFTGHNHLSL